MKKRFSEEQIIRILQEGKTRPIEELCREHGIAKGTFCVWKNKFGDFIKKKQFQIIYIS